MAVRILLCILMHSFATRAQAPQAAPEDLGEAVDAYLMTVDEGEAATRLEALMAKKPAVTEVVTALRREPPPFPTRFELRVPIDGQSVALDVRVPEGHTPVSRPLPVVVNLRLGRIPDTVDVPGAINVWTRGFKPERGSVALWDGFLKIANIVAWRTRGDARRLWLTGFSWAGHGTFEIALRRPGHLRGFVAMAGAPRRRDFRLLGNLEGLEVFAFCGTGDDRELIWNLRELEHVAEDHGFGYEFKTGQVPGRFIPVPEQVQRIAPLVAGKKALTLATSGVIRADDAGVRNRFLVLDRITEKKTKIPKRIPVPANLDFDGQRRKTLEAMEGKIVSLAWQWSRANDTKTLTLKSDGVRRARLLLRSSRVGVGERFAVLGCKNRIRGRTVRPDLEKLLQRVREDGDRLDPCLEVLGLRF